MTIIRSLSGLAAATLTVGVLASGCAKSAEAPSVSTTSSHAAHSAADGADLASLVPAPGSTTKTKGPDGIEDNGIHLFYEVAKAPTETMNDFKSALEAKGWEVTTIVSSSGGEGGGATYTGTHGDAYGVFDGGGYKGTTFIDVCTWPVKPAHPNCRRGER